MCDCIAAVGRCLRSAWRKITCRKIPRKTIVLLVVGLDNAGKSAVVNYLFNKSLLTKENVVPTIGFRTVTFKYKSCTIRLYDVGGGPQIRALWPKYYSDVHGVIYVVDSSDTARLNESAKVFQEVVCHDLITKKPVLLLGNKQDLDIVLDQIEITEQMNVERVVNYAKCYTRVEICSCYPDDEKYLNLNKKMDIGFEWLVDLIYCNYEYLEEEIVKKKKKQGIRRSFRMKTWTAQKVKNPFEYPELDEVNSLTKFKIPMKIKKTKNKTVSKDLRPIIPEDININYDQLKRRRKRKFPYKLLYKRKNRTAPATNEITRKSMKELIRSIKVEDLMKNFGSDENDISEYRRPKRRRTRKRPNTAPAAAKSFELKPIQRANDEPITFTQ